MNCDSYERFHETKSHTAPDFSYNTYVCTIPLDFPAVPTHWHDEIELIIVKRGKGVISTGLESHVVAAGAVVIIPSGHLHSISALENERMEYENILFKKELLSASGNDLCVRDFLNPLWEGRVPFPPVINESCAYHRELLKCIDEADRLCDTRPLGYQLCIKSLLFRFAYILISNLGVSTAKKRSDKSLEKVKLVLEYVHQGYAGRLSVDAAAALCFYSKAHFMKFFKAALGVSFITYVNDYRLSVAADMLLSTSDSVLNIAMGTGFESLSYFNRLFKRKYGVSPNEYRKR